MIRTTTIVLDPTANVVVVVLSLLSFALIALGVVLHFKMAQRRRPSPPPSEGRDGE